MCKSAACLGGFSLTKAPSFAIRNSDCKIHPQRRLNDREFRALRSSTKGFAFGNHSLLKKAGENFYFFHTNSVPRGSEQGFAPNQYENWVQAQPAANQFFFASFLFFLKRKEVRAQPARGGQLFSWPPLVWDALWDLGKSVFTLCVGALLWDADGVDHLVVFLLHLGFGSDAGQLHRLQRLIDAV